MKSNAWNPNELFDKIVKISWLYVKVFWTELLNNLIYDEQYERSKRVLSWLYGYENLDEIYWKQIKREEFKKISKIIFRFYDGQNQTENK